MRSELEYAVVTVSDPSFVPITAMMIWSFRRRNPWYRGNFVVVVEDPADPSYRFLSRSGDVILEAVQGELKSRVAELVRRFPVLGNVYPRFFALEVFRLGGFARLLFLDSDILCKGGLQPLFEISDGLHAAPDSCFFRDQVRDAKSHRRVRQGVSLTFGRFLENSFNSGVMVVGREFRCLQVYRKVLEAVSVKDWDGIEVPRLADQIILNRLFAECVQRLSSRWNSVTFLEEEIERVEGLNHLDAKMIHYAGRHKPWQPLCVRSFDLRRWKFVEEWRREFSLFIEEEVRKPEELAAIEAALPAGIAAAVDRAELAVLTARQNLRV